MFPASQEQRETFFAANVKRDALLARRQLWVGEVRSGKCRLAAGSDSSGDPSFIANPCWAADGASLFVTRFSPNGRFDAAGFCDGSIRLERLYQNGRTQLLCSENCRASTADLNQLCSESAAASPDGLLVAAPWLNPPNLIVFGLDRGCIVAKLPGCRYPAWSPKGEKLAAYATSEPKGIRVYSGSAWAQNQPPPLAAVRFVEQSQPPVWDRAGETLLASHARPEGSLQETTRLEILRIGVADGRSHTLLTVSLGETKEGGACFAYEPALDSATVVIRPEGRFILDRFELDGAKRETPWHPLAWHSLDDVDSTPMIPLGGLSPHPTGRCLAFRFGAADGPAPLAVWDNFRREVQTFTPNDSSRLHALHQLAGAAKRALARNGSTRVGASNDGPNGVHDDGARMRASPIATGERLSVGPHPLTYFPPPSVLTAMEEMRQSLLFRIAGHGLAILDTAASCRAARPPAVVERMDEMALFFHYVRREYPQALAALDRLCRGPAGHQDRSLAFAVIRAQCLSGMGDQTVLRWRLPKLRREREAWLGRASEVEPTLFGSLETAHDKDEAASDEYLDRLTKLLEREGAFRPQPPR
jgi:hypothetical protein